MTLRKQLIGTWKSHRKRTLDKFVPYLKQKDSRRKRHISSMFGKLELKWTEKYIHSSFKNHIFKDKYEIIDESEDTLVIKIEETFPNDELGILNGISYHVIQFEETRYHKYYSVYDSRWKCIEWFQKVST